MSSESEQRNSTLDKLKRQTPLPPSLMEQQTNILYTMPKQTLERLETVLQRTLALQEHIRGETASLATLKSLEPLATSELLAKWLNQTAEVNQELYPAAVRTGWEEARRIYQKAVRYGGDFSEELGWETAGTGKEQLQDHPEFGGNFDAGQYPAVDPAEIADDVLRLIRELERSENLEIQDATTRHVTRERKALAKEWELKIAMGNQADDHEEQKMM